MRRFAQRLQGIVSPSITFVVVPSVQKLGRHALGDLPRLCFVAGFAPVRDQHAENRQQNADSGVPVPFRNHAGRVKRAIGRCRENLKGTVRLSVDLVCGRFGRIKRDLLRFSA